MNQFIVSKRFFTIAFLCVVLNVIHGFEVSVTGFYKTNPDFYPYTRLFSSIPEAVYYVQHGVGYVFLILMLFFVKGGKWALVPLWLFALLLVSETHHFFRMLFAGSYQSGAITSAMFIVASIFYIKELVCVMKTRKYCDGNSRLCVW